MNCLFLVTSFLYTCQISELTVTDNENTTFVIGGIHQPGLNNDDVQRVTILFSNIPFIITQIFAVFPNVIEVSILGDSGLRRIQSNAFAAALNVREMHMRENSQLRTIEAKAFTGMINLRRLDLTDNRIESIHEEAFDGLFTLRELSLANNQIRQLRANVFRPLRSLEDLFLRNNLLESLDGRLLANNPQISGLQLSDNQINAIQSNFIDNNPQLVFFNILGNRCANNFWIVQGPTTLDDIREGLKSCFNNFVEAPEGEVKIFMLELRGSFTIRNDDGSEIIRV